MPIRSRMGWIVFGLLLLLALGGAANAKGEQGFTLSKSDTGLMELGIIDPSFVFEDALYTTGGTGLRNQSKGGITLSAKDTVPPMAFAAFAYWAVITEGPYMAGFHDVLAIRKLAPDSSASIQVRGEVIGTGTDPCWPGDTITAFRAEVPVEVINAGGTHTGFFRIGVRCRGASSCMGEDPFTAGLPAPLWEGASLVALYEAPGYVTSIYDVGLAGNTFMNQQLTYALDLPFPTSLVTLWDNIAADGQIGSGRTVLGNCAQEATWMCNMLHQVGGPGCSRNDSGWNGLDSGPLPSLWDTTGHDISFIGRGFDPLQVDVMGTIDCVTPIANIVAQR